VRRQGGVHFVPAVGQNGTVATVPVGVEDKGRLLNIHFGLAPLISLLAGILILIVPKLLNYIVAFYLIAIGLIGLLGIHQLRLG
jgi:hypothetical protein